MTEGCFQKKSPLVKSLIVLLTVLILILLALFINLVIRRDERTCTTEHCIKTSAELMRHVDQSVSPCDDFHAFTCGRGSKSMKELPPLEPDEELDAILTDFVRHNDSRPLIMAKLFNRACRNVGAIEMDQEETILELLYRLGDWPVLRGISWNGTHFDWVEMVKKSRQLGLKFQWFLDFKIYEDYNNTKMNMLQIEVPTWLRPMSSAERAAKKMLFTNVSIFMGANKIAHYEASKTIDFEDDVGLLAELHRNSLLVWANPFPPRMTINELQEQWPNIQWLDLINNLTGFRLAGTDPVLFDALDFIKNLNTLILGTPKRIVADYFIWKIIEDLWPFFSQSIRYIFEQHYEKLNRTVEMNREKFCLNATRVQFPMVAEMYYIQRHVTEQKRQLVREMLFIIQREYGRVIEMSHAMNRENKRRLREQIENLKFAIGGPVEVYDEFKFAENLGIYGFAFKSMNVIDMITERRQRHYDHYFRRLNRPIVNNTQEYYQRVINVTQPTLIDNYTLVIPASLLRESFYDPYTPNYINYGSLGTSLALQIFNHVYQTNETLIDEFEEIGEWRLHVFDEPIRCLIRELGFLPPNYSHNRKKTEKDVFRENLAYFVASDIAYLAYKEWARFLSQEFILPGLKFTSEQLFWIQSSKVSCGRIVTKHDRDMARFRIIGSMRNSARFGRDFSCPDGGKMNPRKKCRIL